MNNVIPDRDIERKKSKVRELKKEVRPKRMTETGTDEDVKDIRNAVLEKIRLADRDGANALLDAWAVENGYENLVTKVMDPVLMLIGEEWNASESFSLAYAYVAAKVTEDMLQKIAGQTGFSSEKEKRHVVIGNIEEDFHGLGRKMVGTFLSAKGWIVHDLGNDVLPVEFVDMALKTHARVIGVSAMMTTTARNIKKLREEIDRRKLTGKIQLAVGGAVFRVCPGLVAEVGGDGTASNALEAPALFKRLWKKSMQKEGSNE